MTTRLFLLLISTAAAGFGQTFTGALVDNGCYTRAQQTVTLRANHDRNLEIDQCAPTVKTRQFAVVDRDGQSLELDTAGNAKAATLVSELHRKGRLDVTVTGRESKETLIVDSISADQ